MLDLYRTVTDRIIAALEAGTPPWMRPWSSVPEAIPMNAQTRRAYRGINFTLLSLDAATHHYPCNRWVTFRQATELGGRVRAGERGSQVIYWQLKKTAVTAETLPEGDETLPSIAERVYPLRRAYTVFNVDQVEGLPETCYATMQPTWGPEARADELLLMSSAVIHHGGTKAFYRYTTDEIQLPPRAAFPSAARYYNVALHELVHWSGPETRCNRQLVNRFGDDAYAAEELIAEMGAAYLCAHCRLDGELRHASYVASWLKVLRNDKRAIFTAAAKAQRAADYILDLAQPPSPMALDVRVA